MSPTTPPSRLELLIERDGGACVWCGRTPWVSDLTVEHLLPRARGGHGEPENLVVACRRCNRRRGTSQAAAFIRSQRRAGLEPRLDLLRRALERLSSSESGEHARYGARQLELLTRLEGHPARPAPGRRPHRGDGAGAGNRATRRTR